MANKYKNNSQNIQIKSEFLQTLYMYAPYVLLSERWGCAVPDKCFWVSSNGIKTYFKTFEMLISHGGFANAQLFSWKEVDQTFLKHLKTPQFIWRGATFYCNNIPNVRCYYGITNKEIGKSDVIFGFLDLKNP